MTMERIASWATVVCIVHCLLTPILAAACISLQDWHDSPIGQALELALIGFGTWNCLRFALKHQMCGHRCMAALGLVVALMPLILLLLGMHGFTIAALLAVAAYQFYGSRVFACCHRH
jgi:hypothetical protein